MWNHFSDACGCTLSMTAVHDSFAIRLRGYGITVANTSILKTLAVDLLNPTPQAEVRKHKLKVKSTSRYTHDHELGVLTPASRLLSPRLDHSSWTSSAPAVLQSPLSSRTPKQLLSAKAAQLFSVNRTHNSFLRDISPDTCPTVHIG